MDGHAHSRRRLAILLLLTPPAPATEPQPPPAKMAGIYVGIGILVGFDNLMYSYALLYLPVSTFALVAATQLAFNSATSRLLNAQRFTALIANSVVVLTFSAALLGVGSSADDTSSHLPRGKYAVGFVLTLAASAAFALILSLFEVAFEKVIRARTLRWVLRVQMHTNVVASLVCVAGLFASGELRMIRIGGRWRRSGTGGRGTWRRWRAWRCCGRRRRWGRCG